MAFSFLRRKPSGWGMKGRAPFLMEFGTHRTEAYKKSPDVSPPTHPQMAFLNLQSRSLSFSFPRNEVLKVNNIGENLRVLE